MARTNTTESPIENAVEVTDERVTELFSLLGDETRLAILLALADASEPVNQESWNPTGMNILSFSELRERVGSRDPGNFNYHLRELDGHFISHSDDGYKLSPAGKEIVRMVLSIAGFEEVALFPTRTDLPCPNCEASTALTHQQQRLYHVCTNCDGNVIVGDQHPSGVLSGLMLDQTILRNRSPEEIVVAQYAWKNSAFALAFEGLCLMCLGRVEGSLHVCDEHETETDGPCPSCGYSYEARGEFVCDVCRHTYLWGLIELCVLHPAAIAFCWEHGIETEFRDQTLEPLKRLFDFYGRATLEIRSLEPPCVTVTLREAGDELHVTFDEALDVVEVTETTAPC